MKNTLPRESSKIISLLCIISFVFFLVFYINNLLISGVLAFVIFYLLSPFVNFCERKGLKRVYSILLIYTINGGVFVLLLSIFIPLLIEQFEHLEKELPTLQSGMLQIMTGIESRLQMVFRFEDPLFREKMRNWMLAQTSELTSNLPRIVSDSLTTLFLTPFLAFFLLRDGAAIKRGFLDLIPNRFFEASLKLFYDMNEQVGSFIRARIAEAAIVGAVTLLGLIIIGFPYAILLALFAALTNLIPYIGPLFGAIPAFVIVLVNPDILFDSLGMNILAVSIVYLTAHILDAVVIIPVVVAKIVNLHPVTVILVIILGAQLLGVLGMIISIPVASLIKLLAFTIYQQAMKST